MTFSMAKTGATFAIALFLLGCAHKQEFFAATPIPASENSRKALTQMLREQLIQAEPLQEVEVTDDYFKCTYVETRTAKFLFVTKGITTVPFASFVYFNRVRHISLFTKKSMWIVVLGDKLREDLFRYATYDEEQAKAFVNTMLGLSGLGASVVAEAW